MVFLVSALMPGPIRLLLVGSQSVSSDESPGRARSPQRDDHPGPPLTQAFGQGTAPVVQLGHTLSIGHDDTPLVVGQVGPYDPSCGRVI